MYNQLLISLQIEEKWYTFRLFFGILSCYYLHAHFLRNSLFHGVRRNFYFLLLRYKIFIILTINRLHFYTYFETIPK